MTPLEIFHLFHHGAELVLAALLLYAVFFAIKRFKIAAWKRGWYVIGVGAGIFILVEVADLLEEVAGMTGMWAWFEEANLWFVVPLHVAHVLAFAFFTAGIIIVSRSVGRVFGK